MDVKFTVNAEGCSLSGLYSEFNVNSRVIKKEIHDGIIFEIAEIYYGGEDQEKIIASLKSSKSVYNIETLFSNGNILIIRLTTRECPILGILKKYTSESETSYTKEEKIEGGKNIWNVSIDNVDLIKELQGKLKQFTGSNVYINLHKKTTVDKKSLFIIREAYDLGFFDVPKRINLLELSATLNIPPTTLDLIIRKSLKYFLDIEIVAKNKLLIHGK
jgi:predicted DNA binding protein